MTEIENYVVRAIVPADYAAAFALYRFYMENTAFTLDEDVSEAEFYSRIRALAGVYPWLVCEVGGRFAGYAYAGRFKPRAGYRYTAELSVYVAPDFQKTGVGRRLYEALMAILRAQNVCRAYVMIAVPNEASIAFHRALGFQECARLECVGYKFGQWHDMALLCRVLREGEAPGAFIPVRDVSLQAAVQNGKIDSGVEKHAQHLLH